MTTQTPLRPDLERHVIPAAALVFWAFLAGTFATATGDLTFPLRAGLLALVSIAALEIYGRVKARLLKHTDAA